MTQDRDFDVSRHRAARTLVLLSLGLLPVVAIGAWVAGTPVWLAALLSAAFSGAALAALPAGGTVARIAAAQAVVGQPIALTAAFSGHPWQMDMHMTFFAALALLVPLVDVRAIVFAAATVVVHHLTLTLVMPSLIYPSVDLWENGMRTLLHGSVAGLQTVALCAATGLRLRQQAEAVAREVRLAEETARAEQARRDALVAQEAAEAGRREAEEAGIRATAAQEDVARREAQAAREARREAAEIAAHEGEARRRSAEELSQVVADLGRALEALSGGDMTSRLDRAFPPAYESLRASFDGVVDRLAAAVTDVLTQSAAIRTASVGITEGTRNLAQRTEAQAASLEETAAAISELAVASDRAKSAAQDAVASSGEVEVAANRSAGVVTDAVRAMDGIRKSSEEIARITGVIDEIAFQTNLLALNAGIEAARAGNAGRGFAVVATEVRALAQRSSEAARNISELIGRSASEVAEGVGLVRMTGESLQEIASSSKAAAVRTRDISGAMIEQASALKEITAAMNDLDRNTQKNALLVQEATTACEALTEGTAELQAVTARFRLRDTDPQEVRLGAA